MHLHIICYVGQCWGNQLYANPGMANQSQHKYSICPTSKSYLKPTEILSIFAATNSLYGILDDAERLYL